MELGVVLGVVAIGFVHGVLPDHGWPIAATYALNRRRRWLYGLLAALILGVGHLVSSVVLVLAYFWFSGFADFADGPWLGVVAGALLILLGIHEYRHGGHGHGHDETHHEHHTDGERGLVERVRDALPGGGTSPSPRNTPSAGWRRSGRRRSCSASLTRSRFRSSRSAAARERGSTSS